MKKNLQRGFTLIELLVVIAIIGILASVVLASLNTARNKGADANIKANLANARAQAELFFDGNTGESGDIDNSETTAGYGGVCDSAEGIKDLVSAAATTAGIGADAVICNDDIDVWTAAVPLKSKNSDDATQLYCVDSQGASRAVVTIAEDATVCP